MGNRLIHLITRFTNKFCIILQRSIINHISHFVGIFLLCTLPTNDIKSINTLQQPLCIFYYTRGEFWEHYEKAVKWLFMATWKAVTHTVRRTVLLTSHICVGYWFAVFCIAKAQQLRHVNRSRLLVEHPVRTASQIVMESQCLQTF